MAPKAGFWVARRWARCLLQTCRHAGTPARAQALQRPRRILFASCWPSGAIRRKPGQANPKRSWRANGIRTARTWRVSSGPIGRHWEEISGQPTKEATRANVAFATPKRRVRHGGGSGAIRNKLVHAKRACQRCDFCFGTAQRRSRPRPPRGTQRSPLQQERTRGCPPVSGSTRADIRGGDPAALGENPSQSDQTARCFS